MVIDRSAFSTPRSVGHYAVEYQVSLAYLVAALCNTRLIKGHQNDYWLKRPLEAEQIRYAADDVKYLHDIFDEITHRLRLLDKIEIAFEGDSGNDAPGVI